MQKAKYEYEGIQFDLEGESIADLFTKMAEIREHADRIADPVFEIQSIIVGFSEGKKSYRVKGGAMRKCLLMGSVRLHLRNLTAKVRQNLSATASHGLQNAK
jgi:hypothetical protein